MFNTKNKKFWIKSDYQTEPPVIRIDKIVALDIQVSEGIVPEYRVMVFLEGGFKFILNSFTHKSDARQMIDNFIKDYLL